MTRLMEVFQAKLKELIDEEGSEPDKQIKAIIGQWEKISHLGHPDGAKPNIFYREAVHDALDQTTAYLLSPTQVAVLSVLVAHISKVVEVLANPNSSLNAIDPANKEDALLSYYFADIRKAVIGKADSNWDDPSEEEKEQMKKRNVIWISLIFRMLCWLLLHDFNRADVKIVPADLKGSRMIVHIG
jgi:hypothetical protein